MNIPTPSTRPLLVVLTKIRILPNDVHLFVATRPEDVALPCGWGIRTKVKEVLKLFLIAPDSEMKLDDSSEILSYTYCMIIL